MYPLTSLLFRALSPVLPFWRTLNNITTHRRLVATSPVPFRATAPEVPTPSPGLGPQQRSRNLSIPCSSFVDLRSPGQTYTGCSVSSVPIPVSANPFRAISRLCPETAFPVHLVSFSPSLPLPSASCSGPHTCHVSI